MTQDIKSYISKKSPSTGEYDDLYLEGLELLQRLSSAAWTDYNEHDPGVTILENLTYTLTSLSYKTKLPIKDILRESKGSELKSGDNGFFVASEILTTNPVTLMDFRKIIIDGITNVKNTWVTTEDIVTEDCKEGTQPTLKGLFHIAIEVYNYPSDPLELKKEKERIIQEVKDLFHSSRNLCEDLYKVVILEPFPVYLKLRLTLNSEVDPNEVFANVYFEINNYITHEVRFYSLWDLQSKKEDTNTIFNGPLLENGFIPESELKDRVNQILPSEVIKLISDISGVLSVDFFELASHDKPMGTRTAFIQTEPIGVPENAAAILNFPETNVDLVFQSKGVTFSPDLNEVQKQLAYIMAMSYGDFKSVSQSINTIGIPKGKNLKASSYYSVREQFPGTYGIGQFGLQTGLPNIRYAQANQLKAYLLPFDQLMANFLSQLTHLYQIYDVHGEQLQSYFYQELEDMPELIQLIRQNDSFSKKDVLHGWQQTLQTLNTKFDTDAIKRLNEMADSLLARFSEEFAVYALKNINEGAYGKKLDNSDFEKRLLFLKRKLISNYGYLSYYRARSFDYTQEITSAENISEESKKKLTPPIIEKTSILLGIKNVGLGPIYKVMTNSGLKIYQKEEGLDILSRNLNTIFPDKKEDTLSYDEIIIVDDEVVDLYGAFYFLGHSNDILKDVMKHGALPSSYTIKEGKRGNKSMYYVLFSREGKTSLIHIAESADLAKSAIQNSIKFIVDLSERCEGVYLLEHLLLAPPYQNAHYGFSIALTLQNTTFEFVQMALESYRARNESLNALLKKLDSKTPLNLEVIDTNGTYAIQIFDGSGLPWAISANTYTEERIAEEALTTLKRGLEANQTGSQVAEIGYYAHFGEHKVDETFFSFQMSFVLPSWPVRFQDHNFRIKFNNVVKGQVPVHITYSKYWIDLAAMAAFEKSYYNWLTLLLNDREGTEYLEACYDLILKIKDYQNKAKP